MTWYVVTGLALAVVVGALLWAARKPVDPYDPKEAPPEAPPRGTDGRRWWRRKARQGPGPGSPL